MSDPKESQGTDFFVEKGVENGKPVESEHAKELDAKRAKVAAREGQAETPTPQPSPKVERPSTPTSEYIKVRLSTLGKLSAPKELHIRNYTVQDALDLSMASIDDFLEALLKILNAMLWEEDFRVEDMHENELEELMLTVYANFWSKTLTTIYPHTEDELKELEATNPELMKKVREGSEVLRVEVPIPSVQTKTIDEAFKEPITIEIDDKKTQFVLPRISHVLNAKAYIEERFAREEKEFSQIKADLEENDRIRSANLPVEMALKPIDLEELEQYNEYLTLRQAEFIRATECQVLVSHDDQVFETFEERMENFGKIDLRFWKVYNKLASEYGSFGVQGEVEVTSPISKEKVTRRFSFPYMDFVPTVELQDDSGFTVSFGD